MLSGFNTNVRHRGVVFHVQTEDSGRAHPHVITHLYHGGTILASEKQAYADQVDARDLPVRVRALMEAQHASMLERLTTGALDEAIGARLGPGVIEGAPDAGAGDPGALEGAREAAAAGHTQRAAGATRPAPAPGPDPAAAGDDRPLDELVLEYLVQTARRGGPDRAAEPTRSAPGGAPRETE
jgi:hypothetical protein